MFSPQKDVKDVFTAIAFEVAYGLGKHVLSAHEERDLPALTPVLRWRKGNRIAARNEVTFWDEMIRRLGSILFIFLLLYWYKLFSYHNVFYEVMLYFRTMKGWSLSSNIAFSINSDYSSSLY